MTDEKSIFTRIIEGEIPCFKVFENDYVYSFLDINPVYRGHVLVIPKEPARFLHELSPKSSSELGKALSIISKSIIEVTGASSYNIIQNNGSQAGQTVFHLHFHILPRTDGVDLKMHAGGMADFAELEVHAQRIKAELDS